MAEATDLIALLGSAGLLSPAEGEGVRQRAARTARAPVAVVQEESLVDGARVLALLREQVSLEVVAPQREAEVDIDALRVLPQDIAERHLVLPLRLEQKSGETVMVLAMADPTNRASVQTVEEASGYHVAPVLADPEVLAGAIVSQYSRIVTRLILRREKSDERPAAPDTTPGYNFVDDATPEQMIEVLLDLLVAKGVVKREEFLDQLKELLLGDVD